MTKKNNKAKLKSAAKRANRKKTVKRKPSKVSVTTKLERSMGIFINDSDSDNDSSVLEALTEQEKEQAVKIVAEIKEKFGSDRNWEFHAWVDAGSLFNIKLDWEDLYWDLMVDNVSVSDVEHYSFYKEQGKNAGDDAIEKVATKFFCESLGVDYDAHKAEWFGV